MTTTPTTKAEPYPSQHEHLERPPPRPRPAPAPRIEIDWRQRLNQRKLLADTGLPPYLLLPEVRELLRLVEDRPPMHFLIDTLWHTGARISEALALRKEHFFLSAPPSETVYRLTRQAKC